MIRASKLFFVDYSRQNGEREKSLLWQRLCTFYDSYILTTRHVADSCHKFCDSFCHTFISLRFVGSCPWGIYNTFVSAESIFEICEHWCFLILTKLINFAPVAETEKPRGNVQTHGWLVFDAPPQENLTFFLRYTEENSGFPPDSLFELFILAQKHEKLKCAKCTCSR